MPRNRFEEVDEVQPDAITLEMAPDGDVESARVHVPAAVAAGRLANDDVSQPLPKLDAFRGTVKLANELKAPVVVMNQHGTWDPEWGDLYRPV